MTCCDSLTSGSSPVSGPGGTGKTRLALQLATELREHFSDRVYFIPLAAITDPDLLPSAILQVLGPQQSLAGRPPVDALKEHLTLASCLLVLDNFEQLLDATPLLADLLQSCPTLTLLVTSRAVLRLFGEHELPVPPLALPDRSGTPSVEELGATAAVALFVQRANAARPGFALSAENGDAVAEICSTLDGLPLAIELAAARIRTLSPTAMLGRMERRFQLLTGGARDLPGRHRTLRATVEWSHELLSTEEQTLFRRLSVFVSGATLEAIEAVCNVREDLGVDVLDGVESLAGQSLVGRSEQHDGEDRFVMLETIREYAREQLDASPDAGGTRQAHAAYCLVLAEEGAGDHSPADRLRWLERCDAENDNYRAAFDWAVKESLEWAYRMAAALFPFWEAREHRTEGAERVRLLLALPDTGHVPDRLRTGVLHVAGNLAGFKGSSQHVLTGVRVAVR